jgi:multimeric flavodoxin WrbA
MTSYGDLSALYVNCTLTRSPHRSNTQGLMDRCIALAAEQGVAVESVRLVDFDVAPGVQPDMREQGWAADAWPDVLWPKVRDADILVIGTPIWLGEQSSICRRLVERLYAMTDETTSTSSTRCNTSASRSRRRRRPAGSARSARARATSTTARAGRRATTRIAPPRR